jgi:phosphoribosylformimino-5-aminoimidazole carboxamide ribonucleotide (ProFAR) isomerase
MVGKAMRDRGAVRALLTDIARDGMLQGVDAGAMASFARETGLQVIASGGVATLEDLRALLRVAPLGVEGVIVGQALYTGAFTFEQARNEIERAGMRSRNHKPRYCEG